MALITLFLDVDGVLNCARCVQETTIHNLGESRSGKERFWNLTGKESSCGHSRLLREALETSRHSIECVLSSSWRKIVPEDKQEQLLRDFGLPFLADNFAGPTPSRFSSNITRWDEISDWIYSHPAPRRRIIILDDDPVMGEYQIRTNWYTGFDEAAKQELIRRLK